MVVVGRLKEEPELKSGHVLWRCVRARLNDFDELRLNEFGELTDLSRIGLLAFGDCVVVLTDFGTRGTSEATKGQSAECKVRRIRCEIKCRKMQSWYKLHGDLGDIGIDFAAYAESYAGVA